MRWDAVDLDRQQITIRGAFAKNGKSRVLPLSDAMTATLRTLQAAAMSELVFPAARGGYQHHYSMEYFKAVRAAGLVGVSIHCLRHSWASRLAESSGDLLLLKELGGWSSLSMVQRYAHLREGRGAEAIRKMLTDRERAISPEASPRHVTRRPRSA